MISTVHIDTIGAFEKIFLLNLDNKKEIIFKFLQEYKCPIVIKMFLYFRVSSKV